MLILRRKATYHVLLWEEDRRKKEQEEEPCPTWIEGIRPYYFYLQENWKEQLKPGDLLGYSEGGLWRTSVVVGVGTRPRSQEFCSHSQPQCILLTLHAYRNPSLPDVTVCIHSRGRCWLPRMSSLARRFRRFWRRTNRRHCWRTASSSKTTLGAVRSSILGGTAGIPPPPLTQLLITEIRQCLVWGLWMMIGRRRDHQPRHQGPLVGPINVLQGRDIGELLAALVSQDRGARVEGRFRRGKEEELMRAAPGAEERGMQKLSCAAAPAYTGSYSRNTHAFFSSRA